MRRKNLLFICSRNLGRGPTAERIYVDDPRVAVRSRGLSTQAARHLTVEDLEWADLVLVMQADHLETLRNDFREALPGIEVHVLNIPQEYSLMDPRLVRVLRDRIEYYLNTQPQKQPLSTE